MVEMKLYPVNKAVYFFATTLVLLFVLLTEAKGRELVVSTNTLVTEDGKVRIHLT